MRKAIYPINLRVRYAPRYPTIVRPSTSKKSVRSWLVRSASDSSVPIILARSYLAFSRDDVWMWF